MEYQVKTRAIYMGDGTFREETVRRPIRKTITKGRYTAKITPNGSSFYVMIVADDGSQHGRVCNYPAARSYANAKTAERGAKAMLNKV